MNFDVGDIIDYAYLWAHQAAKGEESGRKDRPTCLMIKAGNAPEKYFLFPITSQTPQSGAFKEIPQLECKRAGLKYPSYIVLDQYNEDQADQLFPLASTVPRGSFSQTFLREVALGIREAAIKVRATAVNRTAS
jgi:hypothetical protein